MYSDRFFLFLEMWYITLHISSKETFHLLGDVFHRFLWIFRGRRGGIFFVPPPFPIFIFPVLSLFSLHSWCFSSLFSSAAALLRTTISVVPRHHPILYSSLLVPRHSQAQRHPLLPNQICSFQPLPSTNAQLYYVPFLASHVTSPKLALTNLTRLLAITIV